jgi:CHAD domain-containing protein
LYEAAHRILSARLSAVVHWLPLAAEKSAEDIEYVHQLRVSSRRAVEAVRIFSDLIRNGVYEEIRAKLCEIRRAADEARNLDVLYNEFLKHAQAFGEGMCSRIIAGIERRRKKAEQPIAAIHQELVSNGFSKNVTAMLQQLHAKRNRRAKRGFGQQATRYLKPALKKYFRASEADLTDEDAFHNLRIQGKKLRYTMEILAVAFPRGFRRKLYPQLIKLQDSMGIVNDHATAVKLYLQWLEESQDAEERAFLEGMAIAESKANDDLREAFLATWTPKMMARLRDQFGKYTMLSELTNGSSRKPSRPR